MGKPCSSTITVTKSHQNKNQHLLKIVITKMAVQYVSAIKLSFCHNIQGRKKSLTMPRTKVALLC